jgi:hypothetical protein
VRSASKSFYRIADAPCWNAHAEFRAPFELVATVNAFLTVGFSHANYADHSFTRRRGNNSTLV